jgi:hypothetical protein
MCPHETGNWGVPVAASAGQGRSAVGFGAGQDGVNVERAGRVFDEADAVVADA